MKEKGQTSCKDTRESDSTLGGKKGYILGGGNARNQIKKESGGLTEFPGPSCHLTSASPAPYLVHFNFTPTSAFRLSLENSFLFMGDIYIPVTESLMLSYNEGRKDLVDCQCIRSIMMKICFHMHTTLLILDCFFLIL